MEKSEFPPRLMIPDDFERYKASGVMAIKVGADINRSDINTIYISLTEHNAIVSDLNKKLELAKEVLKNECYCNDGKSRPISEPFICPNCECLKKLEE